MVLRVLFCGTPEFAVPSLQSLIDDADYEVVQVATQPDRPAGRGHKLQASPIKQLALQKNIPVITPENISAPDVVEHLSQLKLDVCIVVAYGQILRKNFLNLFAQKCVNLHGSLLPRWRGAAPLQRAVMMGDTETGVCLQVVVSKLDAGAIIGERKIAISDVMNALEVHDQLSILGAELLKNELKAYMNNLLAPQIQDEALVTYAHKITKEEALIDWRRPASEIHNLVRGLAMGPYAYGTLHEKSIKFHKTSVSDLSGAPGEVVRVEKTFFSVACGRGSLDIHELQPESKKRLSSEEFLRGFSLRRGECFGP